MSTGVNKVFISIGHQPFGISKKRLRRFAETVLERLKYRNSILSLVFVSDAKIRRLNQTYLKHSYATDVLAFPMVPVRTGVIPAISKRGSKTGDPRLKHSGMTISPKSHLLFLGEIVISPERARVQAKRFRAPFREELLRYVCHGILHLSGYSDKSKAAQKKMRSTENWLLREVKIGGKGVS